MADITFEQVRQKYPQYKDLSDDQLAEGLHKKYYPDMPFEQFSTKIGYKSNAKTEPDTTYQKMASQGAVDPYSGQYIPGFSQSEINRTFSESGKGVISGIAQTATGLGELLPVKLEKNQLKQQKNCVNLDTDLLNYLVLFLSLRLVLQKLLYWLEHCQVR